MPFEFEQQSWRLVESGSPPPWRESRILGHVTKIDTKRKYTALRHRDVEMKGELKVEPHLTLEDFACNHGITWDCRCSPCRFSVYDTLYGGTKTKALQELLEHWKQAHDFELEVVKQKG